MYSNSDRPNNKPKGDEIIGLVMASRRMRLT